RQRAGTTGPTIRVEGFFRSLRVVGIVKGASVRLDRCRPEHGVVQHAFHAVAVARVTGDAHQIARELEVRKGAARGFEALALVSEAGAERAAAGNDKMLV